MASTSSRPSRRTWLIAGGVAAAAVALLLTWFLLHDAPSAVDIEDAVGAVTPSPAAGTPETVDPQGTWTVDTDAQPYSFDDSTGTFVGFRIDEELSSVGSATAVGRTPVVSGTITLDGSTLTATTITADLSQLRTDDSRRDRRALAAMGVATHPNATFELSEPLDLGAVPAVGGTVTASATGQLTINGVTRTVTVPLSAALATDGLLVVTGSLEVTLADHDVSKPTAPIVLSVADVATVEIQLYLSKE